MSSNRPIPNEESLEKLNDLVKQLVKVVKEIVPDAESDEEDESLMTGIVDSLGLNSGKYARTSIIPGELVPVEIESAYRRGFQQGASIVLQELKAGVSFDDLVKWAEVTLRKWRRAKYPWEKGKFMKANYPPDAPEAKPTKPTPKPKRKRPPSSNGPIL